MKPSINSLALPSYSSLSFYLLKGAEKPKLNSQKIKQIFQQTGKKPIAGVYLAKKLFHKTTIDSELITHVFPETLDFLSQIRARYYILDLITQTQVLNKQEIKLLLKHIRYQKKLLKANTNNPVPKMPEVASYFFLDLQDLCKIGIEQNLKMIFFPNNLQTNDL